MVSLHIMVTMGFRFQPRHDIDSLSTNVHSFSKSSQHVRVGKNNPGCGSRICWHIHFAYLKFLQFIQWKAYAYHNFLHLIHWEAYAYLNFLQCIQWQAHIVTYAWRIETFFQYIQFNHMWSHKLYQATFPSLHTKASTCWHIHFLYLNFLPNVKIGIIWLWLCIPVLPPAPETRTVGRPAKTERETEEELLLTG